MKPHPPLVHLVHKVHPSLLPHTRAREEESASGIEPLSPLPTFDEHLHWPYPLNRIMSCGTSLAQYDVLLLGAITVLGASMGKHVRCSYGGKMMSPCLQTFVVALPASGKGVLSLVRLLAEPIHDEIREQVDESMACYRREKAKIRHTGQGTRKNGDSRNASQQDVPHLGQQHRNRHPAKPDGLRRYRTDMRKRSRHHLHRHRFGIRTLERHHAQSLRPRPTVLQPAHRPRIPRGKENLSFRTSVRHPLTSETTDSHCRERALFPPGILLHACHTSLAKPVRP